MTPKNIDFPVHEAMPTLPSGAVQSPIQSLPDSWPVANPDTEYGEGVTPDTSSMTPPQGGSAAHGTIAITPRSVDLSAPKMTPTVPLDDVPAPLERPLGGWSAHHEHSDTANAKPPTPLGVMRPESAQTQLQQPWKQWFELLKPRDRDDIRNGNFHLPMISGGSGQHGTIAITPRAIDLSAEKATPALPLSSENRSHLEQPWKRWYASEGPRPSDERRDFILPQASAGSSQHGTIAITPRAVQLGLRKPVPTLLSDARALQ